MVDEAEAFPALDATDIATIEAVGSRRQVSAGDYLFRQGDVTYDFYVVLSGEVEILVTSGGADQVVVRHGPGRFVGELSLLSGSRVLVSARVARSGEVLVLPRHRFRHMIATSPRLGDTILSAFIARHGGLLTRAATAIRVIGSRFSPDSLRVREFLARSRIPHEWLDPDRDVAVEGALREFGVAPGELPVVIATGSVLRNPTPGALAAYLGMTVESLPERRFDLVVVGGGPSGLAAAVYGASEGLRTLGVDMVAFGGQAGSSSRIENYLGFPLGISGGDLTERAVVQAEKFGAELTSPCAAVSLREEAGHLVVCLSDGTDLAGRAVIAASGARYRRLDAARIQEFEGNGVYYAATEMEARLCAGSPVVVAGGGNSAGQAAIFLAAAGCPVTVVIRGPDLARSMSRYLVDRILEDSRIDVRAGTTIAAVDGERTLSSIRVDGPDGDRLLACAGLFSFIGADAGSGWLDGCAALDDAGFVRTDRSLTGGDLDERWDVLHRGPLPYETSYPGLFAVGDVRSGSIKRVATAVGEGSAAVRSVHEYLAFSH
jgi:thioredoxin reductase (NADPH)